MTLRVYDNGDQVRVEGLFTSTAGVPTDPTATSFKVRSPAGVETTYVYGVGAEVVRVSTGSFYIYVTTNEVGDWYYRWEGTGAAGAVEPGFFHVRGSGF